MSAPVSIGALLALTGPESAYAIQLRHAIALAFEDENHPCDLTVADDHADAARASDAARQLAGDPRVVAVIGPMNSWTCETAAEVFAASGLAHITPSASSVALRGRGWPTFFRACPADDAQARALAAVADRLVGARRVGALDDQSSFAAPLCAEFLAAAASRGLEPVWHGSVHPGDVDALGRAADAAGAADPDALLIAGLEEPCRHAARTLRERGVRAVFLGTDAIKPTRALRVEGYAGPWLTNSGTDAQYQAPAFHERMLARAGAHASIYTVETWEATRLLLGIVAAGARTRESVRAALAARTRADTPLAFSPQGERLDYRIGIYVDEDTGPRFLGHASELLGV